MTAKSRGFGFVTYRHGDALEKAMSHRPHVIDEKRVDPKRAIPKEMGKDSGKMDAYMSVRKIFVGGIRDKPITEDDLRAYFSQYGDIKDCVIMTDKTTQKSRGFAFVVFDDYDSVDKIVIQRSEQGGKSVVGIFEDCMFSASLICVQSVILSGICFIRVEWGKVGRFFAFF